jgi:imidazolonepropionase-like amidohydrolase
LGTVEVGKRADLILWSGQPLAAASMPSLVLIDGQIVLDRR